MKKQEIRSDIAWATVDRIGVFGYDLPGELIGKINLGDMAFLEVVGRLPDKQQSVMFNALLVTLVEHGIVPSTLASRLTYLGAPESLQGAVAAGLLGLGTVIVGSIEGAAKMLSTALPSPKTKVALAPLATRIVAEHMAAKRPISGLGHSLHKPTDPRATRLFALARKTGFSGPYIRLLQHVQRQAETSYGRILPINATGAIGAICCEMQIPWQICRGMGVMARAIGLVGHILEESRMPMATEMWQRVEEEASSTLRGKFRRKR